MIKYSVAVTYQTCVHYYTGVYCITTMEHLIFLALSFFTFYVILVILLHQKLIQIIKNVLIPPVYCSIFRNGEKKYLQLLRKSVLKKIRLMILLKFSAVHTRK
uniref:Uncharacterized protein n=1 Tax=Strigamia maritima TaxID=126957 RepID=T1IIE5_STRMM